MELCTNISGKIEILRKMILINFFSLKIKSMYKASIGNRYEKAKKAALCEIPLLNELSALK